MENNYIQAPPGGSSNSHTRARGLVTGLSIASTSACLRVERGGVDVEAEEVHLGGGEPNLLRRAEVRMGTFMFIHLFALITMREPIQDRSLSGTWSPRSTNRCCLLTLGGGTQLACSSNFEDVEHRMRCGQKPLTRNMISKHKKARTNGLMKIKKCPCCRL